MAFPRTATRASKLSNVFVQISKCIYVFMYLFVEPQCGATMWSHNNGIPLHTRAYKLQNIFVQILKCICPHCKMYLYLIQPQQWHSPGPTRASPSMSTPPAQLDLRHYLKQNNAMVMVVLPGWFLALVLQCSILIRSQIGGLAALLPRDLALPSPHIPYLFISELY